MHGETRLLVDRASFRDGLLEIVEETHLPLTVRQIFYLATVRGLVPKAERGYDAVQQQLVAMRDEGLIPYDRIVDNTRRTMTNAGWSSPESYLRSRAYGYFADMWQRQPGRVIVTLEKDALSTLCWEVCARWQVPLFVTRGYGSVTFLRDIAKSLEHGVTTSVLMLGDCDPSGLDARDKIVEGIAAHRPDAQVRFIHVALTPKQVIAWNVPTRPTKASDSRTYSASWQMKGGGESAELDAIPPAMLQQKLEASIKKRIDHQQWEKDRAREAHDQKRIELTLSNLRLRPLVKRKG